MSATAIGCDAATSTATGSDINRRARLDFEMYRGVTMLPALSSRLGRAWAMSLTPGMCDTNTEGFSTDRNTFHLHRITVIGTGGVSDRPLLHERKGKFR